MSKIPSSDIPIPKNKNELLPYLQDRLHTILWNLNIVYAVQEIVEDKTGVEISDSLWKQVHKELIKYCSLSNKTEY